MNALSTMAAQLAVRPAAVVHACGRDIDMDTTTKAGQLRTELLTRGQQTARDLAARLGLRDSGLVGALLKNDLAAGRVVRVDGHYRWNFDFIEPPPSHVKPSALREVIVWHETADDDFPDADLTVIVRTVDNDEPVWLGFWDGNDWRDTQGQTIDVVRWADMPRGDR